LCPSLGVDSRLYDAGQRPKRRPGVVRQEDLPELIRALIAVARKRGRAQPVFIQGVPHVRLITPERDISILRTDWDKIEPLIKEGLLDSQQVAVRQPGIFLYPYVNFNEPVLDWADRPLYYFLLGQLKLIFTEEFPTSDL
jgi:hypothetical protein